MRYIPLLVALALLGCGKDTTTPANSPCGESRPGSRLSFPVYEQKLRAVGAMFDASFRLPKLLELNDALDADMASGLYEVFASPDDARTQVIYGSFSAGPHFKDGASGFRAIWTRTMTDRRFFSVITFWTFAGGKLRLVGGPDGLRVRSQIEGESALYARGRYAGLSYELALGPDGKVTRLAPGIYANADGTLKAGLPGQAMPTSCNGCHGSTAQTGQLHHAPDNPGRNGTQMRGDLRDFRTDEAALTPANVSSIERFVGTIPERQRTRALVESFTRPRQTFFPTGIVEAVRERCRVIYGR